MDYGVIFAAGHSANSMFSELDPTDHYEPTLTARELKRAFLERNISLNTADIQTPKPPKFELYVEGGPVSDSLLPKFIILTENPLINPLNRSKKFLASFQGIFGWDSYLSRQENYVKVSIPSDVRVHNTDGWKSRDRFCCLINSNKWQNERYGNDLYAERLKIIRWYEKNYPEIFDLWGFGWDKPSPRRGLIGKSWRNLQSGLAKTGIWCPFPSWRGKVQSKGFVLRRTKFCFCYENCSTLEHYITEKIFDAMTWGCIPIYRGAPDIALHIPKDTFIDARNFKNTGEIQKFLLSISSESFHRYQENIFNFLNGPDAVKFSGTYFSETVSREIMARLESLGA